MKTKRGFTLVETVLYVALFVTVGALMTGITMNSLRVSERETANTEVVQQLDSVMGTVQRLVGDASLIEAVYKTDSDIDPTNDFDGYASFDEFINTPGNECDDEEIYCTLMLRFEADNVDPTWIVSGSGGIYLVRGDADEPGEDPLEEDNVTVDQLITDKVVVDFLKLVKYELPGGHAQVRASLSLTYNTDNDQFKVTRAVTSAIGRATAATFDDSLLPNVDNQYDIGLSGNTWRDGYFSGDLNVGGDIGIGATPLAINGSSALFPNVTPKLEVRTGTAGGGPYQEAMVVRHSNIDATAVLRRLGFLLKLSSEGSQTETNKMGGMVLDSWQAYGNTPSLSFVTQNEKRMTIDYWGDIGIGTTYPEAPLHIVGTDVEGSAISDASLLVLENWNPVALQLMGYSGRSHILMSTSDKEEQPTAFHWSINNWGEHGDNLFTISRRSSATGEWAYGDATAWTHALTIDDSGNFWFGGGTLNLKSSDTAELSHYTKYSSTVDGLEFGGSAGFRWMTGTAGANERMRLTTTGLGIGMTPTAQLELSTDSAKKPTSNTWTISSDERLKTDIRPFTDGLDVIMGINPVWYKYNGKGGFTADGKDNIGVIAQDIQDVAPYTVSTYMGKLNTDDTQDTELLNFNSHAITFNLINAVKELKLENDTLKARIEALETGN